MRALEERYQCTERIGMFCPGETQWPALWRLALMGLCLTMFSGLFMIGTITVISWVI